MAPPKKLQYKEGGAAATMCSHFRAISFLRGPFPSSSLQRSSAH